jgi:hypothetical protein
VGLYDKKLVVFPEQENYLVPLMANVGSYHHDVPPG